MSTRVCRQCKAPLPSHGPAGVCPACQSEASAAERDTEDREEIIALEPRDLLSLYEEEPPERRRWFLRRQFVIGICLGSVMFLSYSLTLLVLTLSHERARSLRLTRPAFSDTTAGVLPQQGARGIRKEVRVQLAPDAAALSPLVLEPVVDEPGAALMVTPIPMPPPPAPPSPQSTGRQSPPSAPGRGRRIISNLGSGPDTKRAPALAPSRLAPRLGVARPPGPAPRPVVRDRPAAGGSAQELYQKGLQLLLRGQSEDALSRFHSALNRNPRFHLAYRGLGLAYEKLGRRAMARNAFSRYLALRPDAVDTDAIRKRIEMLR